MTTIREIWWAFVNAIKSWGKTIEEKHGIDE